MGNDWNMKNYIGTIIRSLIFLSVYSAIFGLSLHTSLLQNTSSILIIMVSAYIIIFISEARSKIKKSLSYDTVCKGCFLFSFLAGLSWSIPFIVFGEGVDGPFNYDVFDVFLISLGGVVLGGIVGLIGIIFINQFYGILGGSEKTRHCAKLFNKKRLRTPPFVMKKDITND